MHRPALVPGDFQAMLTMSLFQVQGASRPSRLFMLLWPLAAAVLIALVWWMAVSSAGAERGQALRSALKEADAAAQAYEQYLTRSVAQMDQVSLQLRQSWEQSHGRLDLQDLTRAGMFLDSAFLAVSIVDRLGVVLTSTRAGDIGKSYAGADFFAFHRNNNSSSLTIGTPNGARDAAHAAVLFTRRLETADDEFGGVVVVTAPARYFTSFYMPSALGRDGMVATMGGESGLRIEQGAAAADGPVASVFPHDASLWSAPSGAVLAAGAFPDGRARVLAWRRSPVYPLVALVALSQDEAMAGAELYWSDSRNHALLATVCLALMAVLAAVFSRRAALRQSAEEDLRIAYRTATENANDGFYMALPLRGAAGDIADFEIVDCNERGAYFYGRARRAMIGTRLSTLDGGIFGESLVDSYRAAMQNGFHEEEREMPANHRLKIQWAHRRLVRVGNGLAVTLRDISERKAHVEELQRLANEDLLTGLPNRHWLMGELPGALAQARAGGGELALLFIDLDEFKYVNDVHGHAAGDLLLKAAGERLCSQLRPGDKVVRFGGDEFIVLLAAACAREHAERVAERIVSAFGTPFLIGDELLEVGTSIGISIYPRDGTDAAALIKQGDIAMYAGKTEGKGQYRFFEPSLSRTLQARVQFKHSLVEAIERDQFELYYQPRVDARSGELCSMEALLRWIHPERGMVSPLEFIPLAESSGLIVRLGALVMDKACAQIAAWRAQGLALVPVSINVSPKQFVRGEVHRQLADCLRRHAVSPSLLEVEITESAMLGEQSDILAELAAIRALGIKLHVDDFGTGYSSLSQLQKLKMDVLKVDRAFTAELGRSREGRVFFQAIVSMAHALGMGVVAEGVETPEQLRILQELDCNEVQGYLLARPLPAAELPALMVRRFLFPPNMVAAAPAAPVQLKLVGS